jgi:CRP-like cAMP-binding protein
MHQRFATACVPEDYTAGTVIFKQGDASRDFYIVRSGELSVSINIDGTDTKVRTMTRSDYFGEKALLTGEQRSATIKAETAVSVFKVTNTKFRELGLHEKLHLKKRAAMVGAGGQVAQAKTASDKTQEERVALESYLKNNENLAAMTTLDTERLTALVNCSWEEKVPKGQAIIKEGDINADYFYIVKNGMFEVILPEKEWKSQSKRPKKTITAGASFGELALLVVQPRSSTVVALEDAVVWVIDRGSFKSILMRHSAKKMKEIAG